MIQIIIYDYLLIYNNHHIYYNKCFSIATIHSAIKINVKENFTKASQPLCYSFINCKKVTCN